jgi:hypothetical protein
MNTENTNLDVLRRFMEQGLEAHLPQNIRDHISITQPSEMTPEALRIKQELEKSIVIIRLSDGTLVNQQEFKALFKNVSWSNDGKITEEDISLLMPGAQPVFRGPDPEVRDGFMLYRDGIREEGGKYYLNYSYKAIT